jgi:hypothetical protein
MPKQEIKNGENFVISIFGVRLLFSKVEVRFFITLIK